MLLKAAALLLSAAAISLMHAQPYSATVAREDGVDVIRLVDSGRNMQVSIAPKVGAMAYAFLVNGHNALYFPADSIAEFAKAPRLAGVPLLWPWANRLDRDGFFFEGKLFRLQEGLAPFRRDGSNYPIHGLLAFSDLWETAGLSADDQRAEARLVLEFSRHPELMGQFPFAHTVEMRYSLGGGGLEVTFRIDNHSARTMPVSLGFHPYFQVTDSPRGQWSVELPAASIWKLNERVTPTGEKIPSEELFPQRKKMPIQGATLDHVFGDLERGARDEATFVLRGDKQAVAVDFGPTFDVAVVYAPQPRGDAGFVCFEPMAGVTNAINLAHEGRYSDLQTIPPGESWSGYFRVRPTGF